MNKFHRRLLTTIITGDSGSGLRTVLLRAVLGRKRMHNTRLYTSALKALLGLEQAGYLTRRGGSVSLTVEGWLAAMSNREGSSSGS